ncbi:MAG: Asp-tRNA(Asn)/Glu-tRNA(Gln) amidotransferase subunit GatC [Deltaproteobacteria bacterium]|nr:Asp-tRNA(Asn)/Glu-tRNA(Gln) amidotransferase subunit GatC [Deltaproteobacteria bacterium]
MILRTPSIRDVIAFPKNRSAFCPLTEAPSWVELDQIQELGLTAGIDFQPSTVRDGASPEGAATPSPPRTKERISTQEVIHVASLSRLSLNDAEIDLYRKDLNAVLGHVEALKELDTEGVPPMSHVLELRNVWRDDEAATSEGRESILKNAPDREHDYFKVPRVLEG